jgi:hypothetical protein
MKTLLLFHTQFLLLLVAAQTDFHFADSTAQWNVLSAQYEIGGPRIYLSTGIFKIAKDTIIGQYTYQEILETHNYFIRKDSSQKVFGLSSRDSAEHLLYDFGLGLHDSTIVFNALNDWPYNSFGCRVDSSDTVVMDRARKRLFISYNTGSGWFGKDKWIEGIGSTDYHFLSPGNNPQALDGPVQSLLCFMENGAVIYHDTSNFFDVSKTSCLLSGIINGVRQIAGDKFSLVPNPCINGDISVSIHEVGALPGLLKLFDITGKLISQKQLTEKSTHISLNDVSKGLYLYDIISTGQKISSGKLVVE